MHTINVCTDCVYAHEYGWRPVAPDDPWQAAHGAHRSPTALHDLPLWWVGDADQVTPDEPWFRADAGRYADTGDVREFSWSPCDACGSKLGGARYEFRSI